MKTLQNRRCCSAEAEPVNTSFNQGDKSVSLKLLLVYPQGDNPVYFAIMTSEASTARQQILETASLLFYQKGIQNVGINEVIAQSGVAKRTLYRHFPSKDDLILEVMQHRARQWMSWFKTATADRGNTPKARLLATFDVLQAW